MRIGRLILTAALALGSAGCASLLRPFNVAPSGLQRSDARLRSLLAAGRYDAALDQAAASGRADPGDELLRLLYRGAALHYAGRHDSSSAALERAAELAEDRYTRSLSRNALALISNDRVLPYEPGRTERLLIPYYSALNYLSRADLEGAAVEARRLSHLLQRYDEDAPDDADRGLRAVLRGFAGAVFEAAGEWEDAGVAYRNASRLAGGALPWDTAAADTTGEVVVLLEQGFVAHRVEQAIVVALLPEEVAVFADGSGEERVLLAALVATRVVAHAATEIRYGRRGPRTHLVPPPDEVPAVARRYVRACGEPAQDPGKTGTQADPSAPGKAASCDDDSDDRRRRNPYLLKVAWPAYRAERRPAGTAAVAAAGGPSEPIRLVADLSEAVHRDFRTQRTGMVARTIARSAAKLALTSKVEEEVGERDEVAGRIAGLLVNVGGALLEQADTRSWHLLPGSIGMARLRLPPGTHALVVERGGQRVELGTVEVRPGAIRIVSARIWR